MIDCRTATHLRIAAKRGKLHLKGDLYASKSFWVPINAKAANEYIGKASLAYLANVFLFPPIKRYFAENGITADEDLFSLSELIQWVFRSRIREGKPITVYVPSERMRRLFLNWLHADSVVELKRAA